MRPRSPSLDVVEVISDSEDSPQHIPKRRLVPHYLKPLPEHKDHPLVDLTSSEVIDIVPEHPQIPDFKHLDALSNAEIVDRLCKALICPICQHNITDIASTKCGHLYCNDCIAEASLKFKKCPTCRQKLPKTGFHRIFC